MLKSNQTSASSFNSPAMRSSFLSLLILFFGLGFSQITRAMAPENESCLKCHTHQTITFHNTLTKREDKRLMNPLYILDKDHFASGVHAKFKCIDCHNPHQP